MVQSARTVEEHIKTALASLDGPDADQSKRREFVNRLAESLSAREKRIADAMEKEELTASDWELRYNL
tara:strand:+ start:2447 stop:2650 length:204 start_codon:yes stop_codon:yes gene_type:complete